MKNAITASDPIVAEQAGALLATGAIETVLAGALVAAAREPSVLFGPLQIIVGGAGMGLLAVDGRVRQPGRGVERPRGFRPEDEIPEAAYVGAPSFVSAVFAALAMSGNDATRATFGPAITAGKAVSKERAAFLDRISRRGPQALADADVAGELVAAAGRIAGGLLSTEDLATPTPSIEKCSVDSRDDREIAIAPWAANASGSGARVEVVVAADARGRIAAACYEVATDAVPLGVFDLSAPKHAAPVLRGQERVRPGDALAAPAPLAIFQGKSGWEAIVGASDLTLETLLERATGELIEVVRALGPSARMIARADDRVRVLQGS